MTMWRTINDLDMPWTAAESLQAQRDGRAALVQATASRAKWEAEHAKTPAIELIDFMAEMERRNHEPAK